jgi:hypothetical protein
MYDTTKKKDDEQEAVAPVRA